MDIRLTYEHKSQFSNPAFMRASITSIKRDDPETRQTLRLQMKCLLHHMLEHFLQMHIYSGYVTRAL